MSLRSALSALVASKSDTDLQTDKRNELVSTFFGSKRFILVIALVAFVYLTYQLLNIEIIKLVANVAIVYIIGESLSNVATTVMNGMIKLAEIKTDVDHERMAHEKALRVSAAANPGVVMTTTPAVVQTKP